MGKRVKKISMRAVFIRYLALTGICCLILAAGSFMAAVLLQNMGILYRADAGARASMDAVAILQETDSETFDGTRLPSLCRYVVFEKKGADRILFTNMDEWHLKQAMNAWHGGSGNIGYMQYHMPVELLDGAVCLLQYDYAVAYVNPKLQAVLPDFQTCHFLSVLLLIFLVIGLFTRHYARLIVGETRLLTRAGARIAGQEFSAKEEGQAKIKEFEEALQVLDRMREELEKSLQDQWKIQQERNESIAALSHDLKTPLTVIGGNAELLSEEALSEEQRLCVDMILQNAEHAGEYLDRLRTLCVTDQAKEESCQKIDLPVFYRECCGAGMALCRAKRLCLAAQEPVEGIFTGYPKELLRALTNILENAVRYTPEEGRIIFKAERNTDQIIFTVQDGGPGFSAEALKRAGEMLYTSEAARPRGGHQGMGLYFARRVAKKHGGALKVSNTEEGGCVILIVSAG